LLCAGRDINHVAKLGLALSLHRRISLDYQTLIDALDAWSACRKDLAVQDFE
jgi:hypothetical protein